MVGGAGEAGTGAQSLATLIVDDEPLAVERMQVICARIDSLRIVGTAGDGAAALRMIEALTPDLVLLDMTMPQVDGLSVARRIAETVSDPAKRPAVVFVTAHDSFAVEAFDLDAVDYVLKPVAPDRLQRAIDRALARRGQVAAEPALTEKREDSRWIEEFWVPHKSELLRVSSNDVHRIDAERDYVRLHVGKASHLLLETIGSLADRLNPERFIRVHRSTILRKDFITGLRHEGLGVWCAEVAEGEPVRIGRTHLKAVKAMAGR
ncbi:LytR/AlgR family response regulator transcription factor [Croceicoccus naphthovorans]|uniref:LytTR family transcriptional regulator n=1 Tax=Croceicoccus naphthovorans TaxID=1348774 RepID=A0A0G3XLD6_9SPHN|nr:LytTR family DNA-binding domain-containing protein [Croceicoccus naphthovorans]AKM11223.1 LytTR family transcriptional regulator [Croceicoccus naphthovorans]MBB3989874.1 two-component system response regulator AlgR [Croceicoccus naphthovorans]